MKFLLVPTSSTALDFYTDHSTYHAGDSGLDLFVVRDQVIHARSSEAIDLQVKCQLTDGKKYFSYNLYSRSSISKTPLILANGVGLIDSGYLGNLQAVFYNTSERDYTVKKGERYVQLARADLGEITYEIRTSFGPRTSSRGTGGFGSTSK